MLFLRYVVVVTKGEEQYEKLNGDYNIGRDYSFFAGGNDRFGTPALIKHDSDIETAGETAVATMLFHAVNGGLSTGEVTVNGITFATNHNVNLGIGNVWVQTSNWPYNNNNAGALSYLTGLSTNMQALLDRNVLGGNATAGALTLNNLTVGATV